MSDYGPRCRCGTKCRDDAGLLAHLSADQSGLHPTDDRNTWDPAVRGLWWFLELELQIGQHNALLAQLARFAYENNLPTVYRCLSEDNARRLEAFVRGVTA